MGTGGGHKCATLPAHTPRGDTAQTTPPSPGWGGDKDVVPLCTPTAEEAGLGVPWQDGGAAGTPPPPHPAPSPAAGGGEAGSRSPQDGWVELNPIWFH